VHARSAPPAAHGGAPVGRADDEDALAGLQAVDLRQQLADDAVHDAAAVRAGAARRRQAVQLVEEEHARPRAVRALKHLAHLRRARRRGWRVHSHAQAKARSGGAGAGAWSGCLGRLARARRPAAGPGRDMLRRACMVARGRRRRRARAWRSDSPMYMLMSSGPLTLRKLSAHSVATALASSVLPVPGRGAAGARSASPPAASGRMCMVQAAQGAATTGCVLSSACTVVLAHKQRPGPRLAARTAARPSAGAGRSRRGAGGAAAAPPSPGWPP